MKKQFILLALLASLSSAMHAESCLKHLDLELDMFKKVLKDYQQGDAFKACEACDADIINDLITAVEKAEKIAQGAESCRKSAIPLPPPPPGSGPKAPLGVIPHFGAAPASPQGGMPGGLLAAIQSGTTLRKTGSTSSLDSASSASAASSGKSSPTSGGLDLSQIGSVKLRPTASAASSDTASSGKASPVGGFDPSQIGSVKLKPAGARASAPVADKPAASADSGAQAPGALFGVALRKTGVNK